MVVRQPKNIPEPKAAPKGFQYRLLREEDREEALLVKAHALEQEHFALSNNFTLFGVAGAPQKDDDVSTEQGRQAQLARFRNERKAQIEEELEAVYDRIDAVIERAKERGRPVFVGARMADRKKEDARRSALTGREVDVRGKGQGPV